MLIKKSLLVFCSLKILLVLFQVMRFWISLLVLVNFHSIFYTTFVILAGDGITWCSLIFDVKELIKEPVASNVNNDFIFFSFQRCYKLVSFMIIQYNKCY